MQRLLQQSRPVQVGVRIPAVIVELSAHAHEIGSPRVWRLLNRAIAIAVSFARRLGYNDPAGLGIEHAVRAAAKGDDPNLLLLADHSRSMIYLTMGAWTPGLKLVRATAARIDRDTPEGEGQPALRAGRGQGPWPSRESSNPHRQNPTVFLQSKQEGRHRWQRISCGWR